MFGTREEFEYFQCSGCGTLQIVDVPDLARFYPSDYVSMDPERVSELSRSFRRKIGARLVGSHLVNGNPLAGLVLGLRPTWMEEAFPAFLLDRRLGIDLRSRVLDFGCGRGHLLQDLHYYGFRNLTGADAFIGSDIVYSTGVRILRRPLRELDKKFDLIMLHHSFEHLVEPKQTLSEIKRLLNPGAYCLIRMPVVNTAWERYGVNWVQLDPPRHVIIYTEEAFRRMTQGEGFDIVDVVYDSTAFQFWGSEQYMRDIPLNDERSHNYPNKGMIFTSDEMTKWEEEAKALNSRSKGDQAAFYLRVNDG